jgi:hypothetical protein
MRQIRQLADAIARIAGLNRGGDHADRCELVGRDSLPSCRRAAISICCRASSWTTMTTPVCVY